MIIRVVRMSFREEALEEFLTLFHTSSPQIRGFAGCLHLELWTDIDAPNVRTTYSHWDSQESLERYRQSELFVETWRSAKRLFSGPAVATSYRALPGSDPRP